MYRIIQHLGDALYFRRSLMYFRKMFRAIKYIFLFVITFCLLFVYYNINPGFSVTLLPKSTAPSNECQPAQNYTILLWTSFFSDEEWAEYLPYNELKCGCHNCSFTRDRNLLNESQGVIFHWRDIDLIDLPLKSRKDQKWILFNLESPVNTMNYEHILAAIESNIDWTMTYRRDSDIYLPYGQLISRKYPSRRQPSASFKNKTKSVVWFVSNCHTESNRELFVERLSRYIDVDIYGDCGTLACNRSKEEGEECYQMAAKRYKFYLSFENSICKDYVTEKLFNILNYDLIPVVLGGADYHSLLPPNSFVDALRFDRPDHLAQHLNEVGSNEELYTSFFEWKTRLYVTNGGKGFCDLCQKLNEPQPGRLDVSTRNLTTWWFDGGRCTQWNSTEAESEHSL